MPITYHSVCLAASKGKPVVGTVTTGDHVLSKNPGNYSRGLMSFLATPPSISNGFLHPAVLTTWRFAELSVSMGGNMLNHLGREELGQKREAVP